VYADLVNADGTEIEQTLKLRVVPVTATVRFLPLGHHAPIQPYVGGGVGILPWRYTESGDWVDASNNIFRNTYTASGTSVGPVFLIGAQAPVGTMALGLEGRYQGGHGDLPTDQGFAGGIANPQIDLSGWNVLFHVNFRF
jgi:hypothetical protein